MSVLFRELIDENMCKIIHWLSAMRWSTNLLKNYGFIACSLSIICTGAEWTSFCNNSRILRIVVSDSTDTMDNFQIRSVGSMVTWSKSATATPSWSIAWNWIPICYLEWINFLLSINKEIVSSEYSEWYVDILYHIFACAWFLFGYFINLFFSKYKYLL